MTTVDRRRWLTERIRFLEDRLAEGVDEEHRAATEAELETLRREKASGGGWWRRLLGLPRRPTDR